MKGRKQKKRKEKFPPDKKKKEQIRVRTKFQIFSRHQKKILSFFFEGVGRTIVVMVAPQMSVEELRERCRRDWAVPLDPVRIQGLSRDTSVCVNFRLRGGMMRVPRDSPGHWTCDHCGITRCWATRSTCHRCGGEGGLREHGRAEMLLLEHGA